jgi:hypothetical protein
MPGMRDGSRSPEDAFSSRLDRHEHRRDGRIPTVSVLVGPSELVMHLLCQWCMRRGRPLLRFDAPMPSRTEVVHAWIDRLSEECDLAAVAATWLSARSPADRRVPAAAILSKTPVELSMFLEAALPGSDHAGAEVLCRRILSEAARNPEGRVPRDGLAARLIAAMEGHARPWESILEAFDRLVPRSSQPVLAVVERGLPGEAEAVARLDQGARVLAELSLARPGLSLILAAEPAPFEAYQARAPESRAKALMRESVVAIDEATDPARRLPDRIAGRTPALAPLLDEATRAIEAAGANPDDPAAVDRARSAAERFLFACLQGLPQTRGLFRLNEGLGFPFGTNREIEADLSARALRLVVEIDGYYHFRDPDGYRRDRRKDYELQKHGYLVVRVLAEDVVGRPEAVLATILDAVALRSLEK